MHDLDEFAERVFAQIVHDVTLVRQPRQIDALDLARPAPERRDHLVGMPQAHLIVVGHDDHVAARQVLRVFLAPLARPAVICRGDQPGLDECVGALLTLDDEHRLVRVLHDAGQVVRQRLDAIHLVDVSAASVRPALPE